MCVLRHSIFVDQALARRVIVTGPGAYRLALEEVNLDLDRFDDLLLQAERAPRRERIRLLTAAVGLAGGPVLEHARYDEWVQEDRLVYEDRTTRAHLDLALDWLAEGERSTCLRHAEIALSQDRYSEEAYRLIMLANHGLGRHDVVRRTWPAAGPCSSASWGWAAAPRPSGWLPRSRRAPQRATSCDTFFLTALRRSRRPLGAVGRLSRPVGSGRTRAGPRGLVRTGYGRLPRAPPQWWGTTLQEGWSRWPQEAAAPCREHVGMRCFAPGAPTRGETEG